MGYNERVHNLRIEYLDAAIAEINAVCNVIENDDPDKIDIIRQQAQLLGDKAGAKFNEFIQAAAEEFPHMNLMFGQPLEEAGDEG